MGLDIYLFKEPIVANGSEPEKEQVGYFRKVNCFLDWVDNNVGTVENCEPLPIPKDKLVLLKETLDKVNKENCEDILPTTEGFFFGNTDYNEYYWQDVDELKEWVDKTLNEFDFEKNKLVFVPWW